MYEGNRDVWNFDEKKYQMRRNVKFVAVEKQEILEEIRFRLATQMKTRIFFLNSRCLKLAQKNAGYMRNLNAADFVLNKRDGLDLGERRFNMTVKESYNTTDFTREVLNILNQAKMSIYLLGSRPDVVEVAAEKIQTEFPNIILSGTGHDCFEKPMDVLKDIRQVKPDLLLVGMEVPIQENWISAHLEELDATLIMAVGDYLDFAAGGIAKAPAVIEKIRLGWAYRLFREPKRLF